MLCDNANRPKPDFGACTASFSLLHLPSHPSLVSDHGVCPPGSLSAGAPVGVLVQSAGADGEACPRVRHDRVDEQAASFLRTVRG